MKKSFWTVTVQWKTMQWCHITPSHATPHHTTPQVIFHSHLHTILNETALINKQKILWWFIFLLQDDKLTLLDVGALDLNYRGHEKQLEVTAIDLNPQKPGILKADFLTFKVKLFGLYIILFPTLQQCYDFTTVLQYSVIKCSQYNWLNISRITYCGLYLQMFWF